MNYINRIVLCFLICVFSQAKSQTLIINEVSNGVVGASQEYVELLVVGTPSCAGTPSLDLRGYYIDDNNGAHAGGAGTGIAQGCVRFSNNLFWSNIPIGTIILVYNDADFNTSYFPALNDLSMTDGNCKLVIPISNSTLFEGHPTLPSASSSAYPTTGFTPGGNWNYVGMANGGDSFHTVNAAGAIIFAVSYGNNNLSTNIYFSAAQSGSVIANTNVTNTVYTLQSNWINTNVPVGETPGAPNSPANAAWISSMNNSCTSVSSMSITTTFTNAACACNGIATANASGSVGGYTYAWSNGQATPTATNLCAGVYTVTATSSIGCTSTNTVAISSSSLITVSVASQTICGGSSAILTATPSVGGGSYLWLPGGQTTSTISVSPGTATTYSVGYLLSVCGASATAMVSISSTLALSVNSPTICAGKSAILTASGANTYSWSTGASTNSITVSPNATTTYTLVGSIGSGCTNTIIATVVVNASPTVSVNSPAICSGQTATLTGSGATTYSWSSGATTTSLTVSPISNTNYTVTGTTAGCTNTAVANVVVTTAFTLSVNNPTICIGNTATLSVSGANTYTWSNGFLGTTQTVSPTSNTNYTINGTNGSCTGSTTATVFINALPNISVNILTICAGQSGTLTATGVSTYTWSTGVNTNSIVASPTVTSTYTVLGTNSSGCTNTLVATLSVNQLPIITINSPSICIGETATLTPIGASTYSWMSGSTLNPLTVSPVVTSTYMVTGTLSGCTNTAITTVTVNPLPVVSINSPTICSGQLAFLTGSGASTYTWSNGSVVNPLTVSPVATSNYSVLGISSLGCYGIAAATVVVVPTPTISTVATPTIVCSGKESVLNAFGATSYTWLPGPIFNSTVSVIPNATSVYTVVGTNGTSPNLCASTQIVLVNVIPQTNVIAFPNDTLCLGESIIIRALGGTVFSWQPTSGVANPSSNNTSVNPTTTTIYTVTGSVGGLCPGTATLQIVVNPLPYVYAGRDTIINVDESYVLNGVGNVPVGFLAPTSTPLICNFCPIVEVNPSETTCYMLKGENEFGCVSYDDVCVNVKYDYQIFIPNSFSPNGDSENDIFIPNGYGLVSIRLEIFDRWGELIFESKDDEIGWNGKNKGVICEQNTYIYRAQIKTVYGNTVYKAGHISLLSNLK
jgi:gliding motility-associated-like protein